MKFGDDYNRKLSFDEKYCLKWEMDDLEVQIDTYCMEKVFYQINIHYIEVVGGYMDKTKRWK